MNFDPSVFDDPEFKEDAVRELVIAPILNRLGYPPTGSQRVTRSKTLRHPFIRVGTRKHPVTTVPDYMIYVDDKPCLVLDAKAPTEDVLAEDHVQQSYSYAIHPEVQCKEFGLCNGRELVIFSICQPEPLLHLRYEEFEERWEAIEKLLGAKYLAQPSLRRYAPDFGTALKRMGIDADTELILMETRLNLFGRVSDELITASANCDFGSGLHCVSFDFPPEMLGKIVSGLPKPLAEQFCDALSRAPFQAAAGLVLELDLIAQLGEETQVQNETFVPLLIKNVLESRFNLAQVPEDPNDVPPSVFKLRDAFVIKNTGDQP
jgi:hypothetical protein